MDKGKKKVKFTKFLSSTKPFWAFTKLTPENQQRFKPKGGTVYLFQSKRNDEKGKTCLVYACSQFFHIVVWLKSSNVGVIFNLELVDVYVYMCMHRVCNYAPTND